MSPWTSRIDQLFGGLETRRALRPEGVRSNSEIKGGSAGDIRESSIQQRCSSGEGPGGVPFLRPANDVLLGAAPVYDPPPCSGLGGQGVGRPLGSTQPALLAQIPVSGAAAMGRCNQALSSLQAAENQSSVEAETRAPAGVSLSCAASCDGTNVSATRTTTVANKALRNMGIGLLLEIGYALSRTRKRFYGKR